MPHVKILMLTVSSDDHDLFTALKNGADGYLLKDIEPHRFFDSLEGLHRGEAPISGALAVKILQEFRKPEKGISTGEARDELSAREIEVLERVVEGRTNKEIGEMLSITENTVKIHLRNILEKLHLQNRIQAAVYAVRRGLVEDVQGNR
jgi:DNA-binding NarL/FixJ family response regulator